MVTRHASTGTNYQAAINELELGDIIGHETISPLHQRQHTFTFPDTAFAFHNHSHAENIHHAAVFLSARRKQILQRERGAVDKLHGNQRTAEDRNRKFVRQGQKLLVRTKIPGKHHAGNLTTAHLLKALLAFFLGERFQVSRLSRANGLNAFVSKIFGESRQSQAGAVDRRFLNNALQAIRSSQQMQPQRRCVFHVELLNGYLRRFH